MIEKNIGLMVFYDDTGKILLQKRTLMSKHGEDWGYFGGRFEKGETPEQAMRREIKEELEFDVKEYSFLGKYKGIAKRIKPPYKIVNVIQHVFITKITTNEFESMTLHEGDDIQWFSLEKAKKLNMIPLDPKIIDDAEIYIKKNR
ncbi:MAG: NUDIX domain-containing protein [Candidatus Woesearchaeota archaeon]